MGAIGTNGYSQVKPKLAPHISLLSENNTGTDWSMQFFKYQNISQYYPTYKMDYIHRVIEEDVLFESSLFPPLEAYKLETYKFEAIFRVPQYPTIEYLPKPLGQKEIEDHVGLMRSNGYTKKFEQELESSYPLADARQAFLFSHPQLIQHSWDSIPEPPVIGRKGFLKRRSASEGIHRLLKDNTYETQPSLEKIVFLKGPWVIGGTENIQLSQGYVDNWVKGGESNVTLSSDLRLHANYKEGKHEWENYIIHKVGVISTDNDKGRVNTDLIEINTKYGHKASKKWYYSFLYNFKTQLFYGYDNSDVEKETPVSGFMAPGYMSFALGMDYKPNSKFTLLLSPLTSRVTFVRDTVKFDQTRFGVPLDKSYHLVNGISLVNNFSHKISDEIKLSSRFDAFYQYLGKIEEGTTRQVQIDW